MRFLIDVNLPRRTALLLANYGHEAVDVRDVGLGRAEDTEIASYARERGFCILTRDFDFSDIRVYPPEQYQGLVVLSAPRNATANSIFQLLEGLLQESQLVDAISGKLAIVEPGRIRLRGR